MEKKISLAPSDTFFLGVFLSYFVNRITANDFW